MSTSLATKFTLSFTHNYSVFWRGNRIETRATALQNNTNNINKNNYEMNSKEGGVVVRATGQGSSLRSRNEIESCFTYDKFPPVTSMPPELKVPFPMYFKKPIYLTDVPWAQTVAQYDGLDLVHLPKAFHANEQLMFPFLTTSYYRMRGRFFLQVSGTPQHQGILLAAAMPAEAYEFGPKFINSMLQSPHVFLSANESTPAVLEAPFYRSVKLAPTFSTDVVSRVTIDAETDFCSLCIMVVNPLSGSTGASGTLNVSVYFQADEADFYVPANQDAEYVAQSAIRNALSNVVDVVQVQSKKITGDFIDNVRGWIRYYTGLHNPNYAQIFKRVIVGNRNFTNTIDIPTFNEKLDPYAQHDRVVSDSVFHTEKDEMLVSNIISKPQYISTFSCTTSTGSHAALFSRPISPWQEVIDGTNTNLHAPLSIMNFMSRAWRGTLKLHIQSSMTNFHYAKLMVVKNYSCDTRMLAGIPKLEDMSGCLTDTIEFSGGGQVHTIDLPYCAPTDELPVACDLRTNALLHGMYYIYLIQPLIQSANVPTTVHFNVYISASDDFSFYGYGVENLTPGTGFFLSNESELEYEAQSVMISPSEQEDLCNDSENFKPTVYSGKLQPIVSMRDFMRRYYMGKTFAPQPAAGNDRLFFARVIDVLGYSNLELENPLVTARKFFYGQTGGWKFKFIGTNCADLAVHYVPPGVSITDTIWSSGTVNPVDANARLRTYASFTGPNSSLTTVPKNCAPQIEMASERNLSRFYHTSDTAPVQGYNLGQCTIECTIPYLNQLEFIGASGQFAIGDRDFTEDLGTFIVWAPLWTPAGATSTNQAPTLTVMCALADESRCGFNVFAPTSGIQTVSAGWAGTYNRPGGTLYPTTASLYKGAYKG